MSGLLEDPQRPRHWQPSCLDAEAQRRAASLRHWSRVDLPRSSIVVVEEVGRTHRQVSVLRLQDVVVVGTRPSMPHCSRWALQAELRVCGHSSRAAWAVHPSASPLVRHETEAGREQGLSVSLWVCRKCSRRQSSSCQDLPDPAASWLLLLLPYASVQETRLLLPRKRSTVDSSPLA
jgi:hypothetical protein